MIAMNRSSTGTDEEWHYKHKQCCCCISHHKICKPDKKAFRREYRFPLLLQCKQTEVSFHIYTAGPPSNAPHILPGNASGLPSPNKLRIKDAINACASAHQGPTVTAHKIFTICCTGAHFEPNTGKENKLPTTATAAKIAVTVNFFKLEFFHSFVLIFALLLQPFPQSGRERL